MQQKYFSALNLNSEHSMLVHSSPMNRKLGAHDTEDTCTPSVLFMTPQTRTASHKMVVPMATICDFQISILNKPNYKSTEKFQRVYFCVPFQSIVPVMFVLTAIFSAVSHSSSSRGVCRLAWNETLVITLFTSFSAFIFPLKEEICSNLGNPKDKILRHLYTIPK